MKKRTYCSHSHIFSSLQRITDLAHIANERNAPATNELVEMSYDRRSFIKLAMATAFSGGIIGCSNQQQRTEIKSKQKNWVPKIAIIGAGIAGLNAGYTLQKAGMPCAIYEAATRTGGRMFTVHDKLAPGLTTEVGGELVDTSHTEIWKLAQEFGLKMFDKDADSEEKMIKEAFFFNARHYSEVQVVEAFRPLAKRIKADADKIGTVDYRNPQKGAKLDHMSIAEYLKSRGASGWLYDLIDTSYNIEFGRDIEEQSCINLLSMIGTDLKDAKFRVYGESDERYRILGGVGQIPEKLTQKLKNQIKYRYRLEAIKSKGKGFVLSFATPQNKTQDIEADFVIMTLPFSILREIDLKIDLPPIKKKCIMELGYGTNSKLMAGFNKRVWRSHGYQGSIFINDFQSGWDNSLGQPTESGGFTFFCGGKKGVEIGTKKASDHIARYMPALEKAFPGVSAEYNNNVFRFAWGSNPFSKGSYPCYKPGQCSSIAGAEGEPVGNLLFAGDHCSWDFQGYMNGAAETGKASALVILETVGAKTMSSHA